LAQGLLIETRTTNTFYYTLRQTTTSWRLNSRSCCARVAVCALPSTARQAIMWAAGGQAS